MKKLKLRIFYLIASLAILGSCSKDDMPDDGYLDQPVCEDTFIPKSFDRHVIAFYPHYRHNTLPVDQIRWEKITRIIYAFARPNADGSINTSDLTQITELVNEAHANGVEVYLSVGGGGSGSDNFPAVAANEEAMARLVLEIRQYLFANCLDGVDIDWEHWTGSASNTVIPAESMAYAEILQMLKQEIEPFGLGLSIDVSASNWGGRHIPDVEAFVDYLQIMAYDFTGPWSEPGPHSAFDDAIGSGSDESSTGLAYWVNYRGWPKDKVILGVPFYGRDFDDNGGAGVTYASILEKYPDAWKYDQVDNIYYNGIATMVQKTQYTKDHQYPGIMIWEIAQDHPADSLSLLHYIDQVLNP